MLYVTDSSSLLAARFPFSDERRKADHLIVNLQTLEVISQAHDIPFASFFEVGPGPSLLVLVTNIFYFDRPRSRTHWTFRFCFGALTVELFR